ncbi:MAG TPA: ABC transporter substrate-binding protein [Acidimicrobiia bacterium]|nr:ABC transporter substrate-binding protein [Acidimicrobiia bacterium]
MTHYPTLLYAVPWIVGMEKGIFEQEGVKITEVISGSGGGNTLRNMLASRVPVGEIAANAAVDGWEAGAPLAVVGGGVQTMGEFAIVTRPDVAANTVAEVDGLKWGFTNPGSVTEGIIHFATTRVDGLSPGAVKPVATGGIGEGITFLFEKSIDVMSVPDPTYAEKESQFKLLGRGDGIVRWYQQSLLVTSSQLLREDPELVAAILSGYRKSVDYVEAHPEESADLYAKVAELDPGAARTSVVSAVARDHWGIGLKAEALDAVGRSIALTPGGPFPNGVPWSEIVNSDFLRQEAVPYELPPDPAKK